LNFKLNKPRISARYLKVNLVNCSQALPDAKEYSYQGGRKILKPVSGHEEKIK
jgi:hypothetical protein